MAGLRDIVRDYELLADEYFNNSGVFSYSLSRPKEYTVYFERGSTTLHEIQALIKSFRDYYVRVKNFEENNGTNAHEYFNKTQRENNSNPFLASQEKTNVSGKELVKQNAKEWYRKAKQQRYQEAKAAIAFLIHYIDLLEKAAKDTKSVEVSDALDKLTRISTGNTAMDNQNRKLLELYKRKIVEDVDKLNSEQTQKVNGEIIKIRKKDSFYQWKAKSGNLLLPTDYKDLGFNSLCGHSFKTIFDCLRREVKRVNTIVVPSTEINPSPFIEPYYDRLKKIDETISEIHSSKSSLGAYIEYERLLSKEEDRKLLVKTTQDAITQIDKLLKLHLELLKNTNKTYSVMIKYEALKQRFDAINEALTVTKAHDLPKTYQMLNEAKSKCIEELKKYESVVRDVESLVTNVEAEIRNFDNLMQTYKALVGKATEEELNRQDESVRERNEFMAAYSARGVPVDQTRIDNIKLDILREMQLEGYKPSISYSDDVEHPEYRYSDEFNEEFYWRLISRLKELDIEYEGADLSNPYDTSIIEEAHKANGR